MGLIDKILSACLKEILVGQRPKSSSPRSSSSRSSPSRREDSAVEGTADAICPPKKESPKLHSSRKDWRDGTWPCGHAKGKNEMSCWRCKQLQQTGNKRALSDTTLDNSSPALSDTPAQTATKKTGRHPQPNILQTVIAAKGDAWSQSTHKVARSDADRILEALVASVDVDTCISALDDYGLEGQAYRYLLEPLHEEAARRRTTVSKQGDSLGDHDEPR